MRASTIMLVAALLYVVHRWATNKKAVDPKTVVEAAFAILVIALLDQGETEPVARGFAWLFLLGAAYVSIPTITKAAGVKLWQRSTRASWARASGSGSASWRRCSCGACCPAPPGGSPAGRNG